MNHNTPYFSVVITTYNRALLVQRALDSLLAQTATDWEAIIIDDGSVDNTKEIILEYQKEYGAVLRYFYQSNQGSFAAKNAGMQRAKGQYITFLDADDEYILTHLETRKQLLMQHPSTRFLHGGVQIIGSEYVPDRFDLSKDIHISECAVSGTFFIEAELAKEVGGFKKMPVGMDGDYLERVENNGASILKTDIPSYVYHHETEDSITNSATKNRK